MNFRKLLALSLAGAVITGSIVAYASNTSQDESLSDQQIGDTTLIVVEATTTTPAQQAEKPAVGGRKGEAMLVGKIVEGTTDKDFSINVIQETMLIPLKQAEEFANGDITENAIPAAKMTTSAKQAEKPVVEGHKGEAMQVGESVEDQDI